MQREKPSPRAGGVGAGCFFGASPLVFPLTRFSNLALLAKKILPLPQGERWQCAAKHRNIRYFVVRDILRLQVMELLVMLYVAEASVTLVVQLGAIVEGFGFKATTRP